MKNTNTNKIDSVVTYNDAGSDVKSILRDNRGKSGVYLWTNKINGKRYVGSSVNMARRFRDYYNNSFLTQIKNKMTINKALLKYGYSSFKLEILEYCDSDNVISREQYYLDLLKPEYNILKMAGSCYGHRHTEETLAKFRARKLSEETKGKISEARVGCKLSEETRTKMSAAKQGSKHSEETRSKLIAFQSTRLKQPKAGFQVKVIDTQVGETSIYDSIRSTAKELATNHTTIRNYLKSQKLYRGRYLIELQSLQSL